MTFKASLWKLCQSADVVILRDLKLDLIELDINKQRITLGLYEDFSYDFANQVVKVDAEGRVRILPLGADSSSPKVVIDFKINRPITLEDLKP